MLKRPQTSPSPGMINGDEGSIVVGTASSNEGNVQVVLRIRPVNAHDLVSIPPRFQRISLSSSSPTTVAVDPAGSSSAGPASAPGSKRNQHLHFHYDRVLGPEEDQKELYQAAAEGLVGKFLQGFNVTILAYGQTSSGKSYSMGTAMDVGQSTSFDITPNTGLIPRAVADIFKRCAESERQAGGRQNFKYEAVCSFVELYNEDLLDLLVSSDQSSRPAVNIREDKGQIIWSGLKEVKVSSIEDVMVNLRQGSLLRRTNETDMNAQSSRSHAIFSLTLTQHKRVGAPIVSAPNPLSVSMNSNGGAHLPTTPNRSLPRPGSMIGSRTMSPTPSISRPSTPSSLPMSLPMLQRVSGGSGLKPFGTPAGGPKANGSATLSAKSSRRSSVIGSLGVDEEEQMGSAGKGKEGGEWVTVTSKFHFVDLAGSERLKRTAALGERMKEGISINSGLLALGNVISALGDPAKSKAATHIPYRDSKLTRLLQDSLGGNAHTLMIACVSPVEYNLTETLSTIKYANRARNIKNQAKVNEREVGWDDLEHLQNSLTRLRKEHATLKAAASSAGITVPLGGQAATVDLLSVDEAKPDLATTASIARLSGQVSDRREKNADVSDRYHTAMTEIARLRRDVEEARLDGREVVSTGFAEMVQPVIEEYEKAIDGLERELKLSRAALAHTNDLCNEQEIQLSQLLQAQAEVTAYTAELRTRIQKLSDRETSTESYISDLEAKIKNYTNEDHLNSVKIAELRKEIGHLKKSDGNTAQYIADLETRLAQADASKEAFDEKIERLESEVRRREGVFRELEARLETMGSSDNTKLLMKQLDEKSHAATTLEQKLQESLRQVEQIGKERSSLLEQAKDSEGERESLRDKLQELQAEMRITARASKNPSSPSRNHTLDAHFSTEVPEIVLHGQDTPSTSAKEVTSSPNAAVDVLDRQLQKLQATHAATLAELEDVSSKYRDALKEIAELALQVEEAGLNLDLRSTNQSLLPRLPPTQSPSSESVSSSTSSRRSVGAERRRDSVPILFGSTPISPPPSGQGFGWRGSGHQQSLPMSLSQELSLLPPSRSSWGSASSLLTTSPARPTLALKPERSAQSFEDEVMSLQKTLKLREEEIAQLENDLRHDLSSPNLPSANSSSSGSETFSPFSLKTSQNSTHPSSVAEEEEQRSVVNELMRSMAKKDTSHRETLDALTAEVEKLRRENIEISVLTRDQALNVSAELDDLRNSLSAAEGRQEDLANELEQARKGEAFLLTSKARLAEEKDQNLASQRAAHEEALLALHTRSEATLARLKDSHADDLKQLELDRSGILSESQHESAANIALIHQQNTDRSSRREAELLSDNASLSIEHTRTLAAQAAESSMLLDRLRTEHTAALVRLSEEHASETERLKAALVKSREEHVEALQKIRLETESKANLLQANHELALAEIRAAHQEQSKASTSALQLIQEELAQTKVEHDLAVTRLRNEHNEEISALQAQSEARLIELDELSTTQSQKAIPYQEESQRLQGELTSTLATLRSLESKVLEGQSQQASSKTELRQLKSNLRNFDDLQRQSVDSISARDVLAKDLESQKLASGRAQTELERRRLEVKELTEDRLQQDVLLHEIQARESLNSAPLDGRPASQASNVLSLDRPSSDRTDSLSSVSEERSLKSALDSIQFGLAQPDLQLIGQLEQSKETINNLNKRLAHCEADLQANIDLINVLEAALNDSERSLRKARLSANDISKERDRAASECETLRSLLSSARAEVLSVKSSANDDNRKLEQKMETERVSKENAKKELERRLEEMQKRKSKFNCF